MKKVFMTALAALALASCSSNDPMDEGGKPGEGLNVPTYATFNFKTAPKSRAAEADDAADEAGEKKTKEFRLIIFNNVTKVCEANEVVAAETKKTVLLTPGQKKIYVFANTESEAGIKAKLEAYAVKGDKTLDQFLAETFSAATTLGHIAIELESKAQAAVAGDYSLAKLFHKASDEGFPMSSTDKEVYTLQPNITSGDAEGATGTLDEKKMKNNFTISLEYMLSKAGLYKGTAFDATDATVSDLQYSIRNLAKDTYLTQQFAGTNVKSVYYSDFSGESTQSDFNSKVDYAAVPAVAIAANKAALATAGNNIYVAENTNAAIRAGQASYIALSAVYLPTKVVTAASHNGSNLTLTTTDWASKTGAERTYLMTTEEFAGPKGTIPARTYFDKAATLQDAVNKATYGIATVETPAVAPKVATYTNGVSWYRINLGATDGSKTTYGVERGKHYQVALNKITGPGVPKDECLVTGDRGDGVISNNPGDPVDAQTYVSVSIDVKGWSAVDQSADL